MSEDCWSRDPVMTSPASTAIVTAETKASGPRAVRPHGPRRAAYAMRATKSPTAPTIEIIGIGKRHHGRRLARKVDAGTDAAATATTRTMLRTRRRVSSVPILPFQTRRTSR